MANAPDLSLRGAKRRGNLAVPCWISRKLRRKRNCFPEIATAPLGPRNDTSGRRSNGNGAAHRIGGTTAASRTGGACPAPTGPVRIERRLVQIGSAFPRLPRPRWGLAMTRQGSAVVRRYSYSAVSSSCRVSTSSRPGLRRRVKSMAHGLEKTSSLWPR